MAGCRSTNDLTARIGPIANIRNGPDLTRLKFIDQYYLAENLGLPAVTDWIAGRISSGYAAAWKFDGARTLALTPRPHLRWSDGTAISLQDIKAHLEGLRDRPRFHAPSFKYLQSVAVTGDAVTLRFTRNVPGVLEELCRADAILESGNWRRTSGPYFIESSRDSGVILRRNPYFPEDLLWGVRPPDRVSLRSLSARETGGEFKKGSLHFSVAAGYPFLEPHTTWISSGAHIYWGTSNRIVYAWVPPRVPKSLRATIAAALRAARAELVTNEHFAEIDQMIPSGYPSHLDDYLPLSKGRGAKSKVGGDSKQPRYVVKMWDGFDKLPTRHGRPFSEALRHHLTALNCPVVVQALDDKKMQEALSGGEDIVIKTFVGNARDADGSWSFLEATDPPVVYDKTARGILAKARHASSPEIREELFKRAHKTALRAINVIPLLVNASALFHHPDLDISRINPLDLRIRFWMMQWKR